MAYAGFRDYEELFDEQEKRWNMPSEPIEDWLARIQLHKHSSTIIADAPIHDAKITNALPHNEHTERVKEPLAPARVVLPLQEPSVQGAVNKRRTPPGSPTVPAKRHRGHTVDSALLKAPSKRRDDDAGRGESSLPSTKRLHSTSRTPAFPPEIIDLSVEEAWDPPPVPRKSRSAPKPLSVQRTIPALPSARVTPSVTAATGPSKPAHRPAPAATATILISDDDKQHAPAMSHIQHIDRSRSRASSGISGASTETDLEISNITSPSNSPILGPMPALTLPALPPLSPKGKSKRRAVPPHKVSTLPAVMPAGRKAAGKKKEKEKLVSPLEYALTLQAQLADESALDKGKGVLAGLVIYYYGSDNLYASESTRRRMKLITNYGATLLPRFTLMNLTHIVTDNRATRPSLLRACSLASLSDVPEHIPVVKWDWVEASARTGRLLPCMEYPLLRMRVPLVENSEAWRASKTEWERKLREEAGERSAEFSRISDFSDTLPIQPTGPRASTSASAPSSSLQIMRQKSRSSGGILTSPILAKDPLAEFYERAREDAENICDSPGSDTDEEKDKLRRSNSVQQASTRKRTGFQCDLPASGLSLVSTKCVNQDILDKLQELKELYDTKPGDDDHWRSFSYSKVIRTLPHVKARITTLEDALSIPGVGQKTAQKIMEIVKTGHLRRIDVENSEDVQTVKLFTLIYGVGIKTAREWYAAGCRTLDDLRARKSGVTLSTAQEIGLRYYDDINLRMPREEAGAVFALIKSIALGIDPELFIEIMGSYRRGKKDCGDIDILITRNPRDGRTHGGILRRLSSALHAAGILTDDLSMPSPRELDSLEAVYRGLCVLPSAPAPQTRRRIDFLTVPWESRGAALLYYTGDDIFNRSMRLKANKGGYSLNQRGLWAGVIRDPSDRKIKFHQGTIIASETEQEIFDILGVPWQEPHERIRA